MSEYLIKRSVEKDVPEIKESYKIFDTDKGRLWWIKSVGTFSRSFDRNTRDLYVEDVEWWLEPITLPEIIEGAWPTKDEEDDATTAVINKWYHSKNMLDVKIERAVFEIVNWLKTKLTKQQEQ